MTETGCEHCEGHRGIESCPAHMVKTSQYNGQTWCDECDTPDAEPGPVGCRCGG